MRRRLVVAIVGTVAAALLLAGLGTLLLTRLGARQATAAELEDQAGDIADGLEAIRDPRLRNSLRRSLDLEGIELLAFGRFGRLREGTPPEGVDVDDLDLEALQAGRTVTGSRGSLVYAAVPVRQPAGLGVVVATRRTDAGLGPAFRWFVLAAAATLLLAALIALRLARRLTEPLRDAELATRSIAGGDLATRVPAPRREADDELADLSRSINSMAAALERSQGLERQFLMSVSHDLRTPLTSIRGFVEAVADGTAPDPRRAAAVILSESRRLERLVHDLLDLSRLDAHQFSLDLAPVDAREVVAAGVEAFRPAASEAGIDLRLRLPDEPSVVSADADRLAQVVANLLENALKYALSTIEVSLAGDGDGVRLTVADDGPGIAAEDLPHVFERLYVTKRTPRRREIGSGLGLAIVRELTAAMGGSVAADLAPGGGARLVVRLTGGAR